MAQAIHGVNKKLSRLSLSYYSLATQIIIINLFTAIIGLSFLVFFNYFLLTNNSKIEIKAKQINMQTNEITTYLQKNAVKRIPQFNEEECKRLNNLDKKNQNNISFNCGAKILSEPLLDPSATQDYLFSKFLNLNNHIRIYDVNLIKYADTESFFSAAEVVEVTIQELPNDIEDQKNPEDINIFTKYKEQYFSLFHKLQLFFDNKKLLKDSTDFREDINLAVETLKKQKILSKIFKIDNNHFYLTKLSPIIINNNIYGIVIVSGNLIQANPEAALTSFNLLNLFLIIIFFMFVLSTFFSKSIVNPIKILSKIVKIEQDKLIQISNNLNYPIRNDEIGSLSKEIKNMSLDLKLRINELENFAADVSHELKNPLASLKSSNELLLENKIKSEQKFLLLNNIQKDIERMNRLISDISNYALTQIEIDGELFIKFDLIELIKELIQSFSNNIKKIKINFKYENNPTLVRANRDKLAQVFINLIDNSFSFSPIESELSIIQLIENNSVIIYIIDQGKGIDKKVKEKIFDRFYTDRSHTSEFHSGLGLSISKKIIESFFGSIELSDFYLKGYNGACFKLKLPLKE